MHSCDTAISLCAQVKFLMINSHRITFQNFSKRKNCEKVKITPCKMHEVNNLCVFVDIVEFLILVFSQKLLLLSNRCHTAKSVVEHISKVDKKFQN